MFRDKTDFTLIVWIKVLESIIHNVRDCPFAVAVATNVFRIYDLQSLQTIDPYSRKDDHFNKSDAYYFYKINTLIVQKSITLNSLKQEYNVIND